MKAVVLNRILLLLGCIGVFIAGVLSASHLWHLTPGCGPAGGCEQVLTHESSKIGGIPVAYFGLLGYLTFAGLAAMRALTSLDKLAWTVKIGYALAAGGTLFSIYLQYISLIVIRHICPWCMASAITMILTLVFHGLLINEVAPDRPAKDPKGTVAVVALVALTLLSVATKVSMLKSAGKSLAEAVQVGSVEDLIPKGAHIYGDPKSPIKLVEFADLLCSHCQNFSPTVHAIVDTHPGKICLVYRHFPLEGPHPMANIAAAVSEYASEKMNFFKFSDSVMQLKDPIDTPDPIFVKAQEFSLNTADIKKRLSNPEDPIYSRIMADRNAAHAHGVNSTPTFIIMLDGDKKGPTVANHNNLEEILNEPRYKSVLDGK